MDTVYLTIPNIITAARLVAIPFIVHAMLNEAWLTAFVLFALAGISDGIDGYIARHFDQDSRFGRFADPIADKLLTFAVYTAFWMDQEIPGWLLLFIIARDVAIVAGAGLLAARGDAEAIRPLMSSKINTALLIVLATWLLAANAFGWSIPALKNGLIASVVALTAISAVAYGMLLMRNVRRANGMEDGKVGEKEGMR